MSLERNKKELLYFLSSHPYASYEKMSSRLKLSKRSIKLLIESLLYSYGHIFSIQEKGEQVSLFIYDSEAFRLLISEQLLLSTDLNSFHKRQAIFFKILLEVDDYISADLIAGQLSISRRSLSRDMVKMKLVLEKYGLVLISKTGSGIRLDGAELPKRLLYLYEVMDYIEDEIDLPSEVNETYHDFVLSKNLPLDVQKSFLYTMKITWLRKDKKIDTGELRWFTRQNQLDLPTIFYEILEYYWKRPIAETEKDFLTFPLQIGLLPAEMHRSDVMAVVQSVLQQTIEEFGIQLAVEESAKLLEQHLIYLLNRSVMKWEFSEVGLREQLMRSSFSIIVAQFFLKQLGAALRMAISDKESVLLAVWMDLLLARNSKPLISRIAVITQAGISFNQLVEQEIIRLFGRNIQLDFLEFTNHQPYEELEKRYDLIFTDNLLCSQELFQSFLSLTWVTKENQTERENIERMVLARKIQLYGQVLTVELKKEASYEVNLQCVLETLVAKGILMQESVHKLLVKERKYPAISENGFAFPHLTVSGLSQITLLLAEDDEVSLTTIHGQDIRDFILLLIPEELSEEHQDLLYQIFDNTFRLEQKSQIKERLGFPFMTALQSIGEMS